MDNGSLLEKLSKVISMDEDRIKEVGSLFKWPLPILPCGSWLIRLRLNAKNTNNKGKIMARKNLKDVKPIEITIKNDVLMASSLQVAKHFGKQHNNVLQDIRKLLELAPKEWSLLNFQPTFITIQIPNNAISYFSVRLKRRWEASFIDCYLL